MVIEAPLSESRRRLLTNIRPRTDSRVRRTSNDVDRKSIAKTTWPTDGEWVKRQRRWTEIIFRKLGLDSKRIANGILGSQALNVLGTDGLAEFAAVSIT